MEKEAPLDESSDDEDSSVDYSKGSKRQKLGDLLFASDKATKEKSATLGLKELLQATKSKSQRQALVD